MTGKRLGGPWYGESLRLIMFERGAMAVHSSLSCRKRKGKGRQYNLILGVPEFEVTRGVTIRFLPGNPNVPVIDVDGPTDSPHRYGETRLCIWHPKDAPDQRWLPDDGLLHLIVLIQLHLFKEEWYRETGEWLGPEVHPERGRRKEPS
jgi:hypothetical protein